LFIITVYIFMQQSKFGKTAEGPRLERIKKSGNYRDGKFQNINFTPDLTEGVSYYKVMKEFFFNKSKRVKPMDAIPSQKTNLYALPPHKNVFVWFGHSS